MEPGGPDEVVTVADLELKADQSEAGDIEWILEPQVHDPKAAVTAAAKPALLFPLDEDEPSPEDGAEPPAEVAAAEPGATDVPADIEMPEKTEAEVDQLHALMDLAEERTGHIEGLVAQVLMGRLKDKRMPGEAVTAGLGDAEVLDFTELRVPFVDLTEVRAALQEQTAIVAAALDTVVDEAAEVSVDDAARVDLLIERLDAIEETVAKLLEEQVEDFDMPAPDKPTAGVVPD